MDLRNSNVCLLGILFLFLPQLQQAKSGIPWPYSNSAHYWPLNKGLRDVISTKTGGYKGNGVQFVGPGLGHLYVNKSVRVVLGTYKNKCIVDPTKCSSFLTVSLWFRYTPRKYNPHKKQFIMGTEARRGSRIPGFSIHYVPHKGSRERIIIKVDNGQSIWAGSLDITPETWTQMAFTWSNSSGLMLYKNCKQMTPYLPGKTFPSLGGMGKTDGRFYLAKAPGQGRGAVKISYDDVAVWYEELLSKHNESLCSSKVEPPKLFSECSSGGRWLKIKWQPPSALYDRLTGYDVWYRYPESSWRKIITNDSVRTSNITELRPSSSLEIRVQNKLHGGYGRMSRNIICNTTRLVTERPVNMTVAATSSTAVFVKWKAPQNHRVVKGYRVLYKPIDSPEDFIRLDVGALTAYLISGLSQDTRYRVQVIAYGYTYYTDSDPVEVTPTTDKDDFSSVLSVNVHPVSSDTLNVSWSPPADHYTRYWYRVFMQWRQGDREEMTQVYTGNKTTCSLTMQRIPFPHTFSVMAFVHSIILPARIKGPLRNVSVDIITWKSAKITWKAPLGNSPRNVVDKYSIILKSGGTRVNFTTSSTSLHVVGLEQLTRYRLNIQAGNKGGYGPLLHKDIEFTTTDRDECEGSSNSCDVPHSQNVVVFDDCKSSMVSCHRNAECVNTKGSFYCKCAPGYSGNGWACKAYLPGLKDIDFCNEETSQDIEWSRTLRGQTDVTGCPDGVTGVARRTCRGDAAQTAFWDVPDLSDCVSQWALNIKEQARDPNAKATSIASQMADLTDVNSGDVIYPGDLKAMVDVIGVLSDREENSTRTVTAEESKGFTKSVVNTASNILDTKTINKWTFIPTVKRTNQAGALINSLDNVALQMAHMIKKGGAEMPNVVLDVRSTVNQSTAQPIVFRGSGVHEGDKEAGNMAVFPSSELSNGIDPQYATYVLYRTLGSLLSTDESQQNASVNSAVLSLTLNPLKRRVFEAPITIVLSHVNSDKQHTSPSCVFWNMSSSPGFWSDEGCHMNSTNRTHTVCQCYHLTSFAILMNVKGDTSALITGDHRLALSLITYIGVVLSVAALCIAFFTFVTFRFLKSSRTFMHKNLAISLIFAQLLFLFGVNKTEIKIVCQVIAGLLHYLWLASFSWMALEGFMLYLMLVKIFGTKTITNKKRVVFLSCGWGLPVIVVAISAGIFPQGYGTEYYCWLTMERGFIWAFVGPALSVIAFNFVVMGITFSVMSRSGGHRRKPSKIRKIRYWAKACTLLTCILGLTWLFGVFYINNETLFMAYFFTIFNSLQGVFIFLFHCLGDEKIRREYVRILCCREKGPAQITSTSKSSKSDSTAKMIKSSENGETRSGKGLDFDTASAGCSMDGQRPVLVMFQKRPQDLHTYIHRGKSGEPESCHSSQRESGEIIMNPRDSLASFTSFQLQNRNSARYSLVSRTSEISDTLVRVQPGGELSVVEESLPAVQDKTTRD